MSLVLPVTELERAERFYSALGCARSGPFEDGRVEYVLDEVCSLILETRERFATRTAKEIVDAHREVEAIFAIAVGSRGRVDELVDRAIAAGGSSIGPAVDRDSFYARGFEDLDGHHFLVVHMQVADAAMSVDGQAGLTDNKRDVERSGSWNRR